MGCFSYDDDDEDELMKAFSDLMNLPPHVRDAKLKRTARISNGRTWASNLNINILKRIPTCFANKETCEIVNGLGVALSLLNLIPIRNK